MVAVIAYFTRTPETLETPADALALLDRMEASRKQYGPVPPMAELSRMDEDGWAIMLVGINGDRGFVSHADPTSSVVSTNGGTSDAEVMYDYQEHVRELPETAEIDIADVRAAVAEFVRRNGARPTLTWAAVE